MDSDTYEEMNIQMALNELEILDNELTKLDSEYLRKKYHKLALKWHPDKNKHINATSKFQKITDSYNYLLKNLELTAIKEINECDLETNVKSTSNIYIDILSSFILTLLKGSYNEILLNIIKDIVLGYETISLTYLRSKFETLDKQQCIELYQLLYKYKHILYISNNILEFVSLIIQEKYVTMGEKSNSERIVILRPLIMDMLEHNIYKLMVDDNLYLVPLWHNELYFDAPDGSEIVVLCQPNTPSNITIDENNNIYYDKSIEINNELKQLMTNEKCVNIDIGGRIYSIPLEKLYLKTEQIYIFEKQGISHISENDIYNIKSKADVIVKIHLV